MSYRKGDFMSGRITQCIQQSFRYRTQLQTMLLMALVVSGLTACMVTTENFKPLTPVLLVTVTPSSTIPPPVKQSIPENWEFRWLKGIPCRPPCWEGITPGLTSATEAVKILTGNSLISSAEMSTSPLDPSTGYVYWYWSNGQDGGAAYYPAQTPTQIISDIFPYFRKQFELRELIQAFGDPTHVVAIASQAPDAPRIFYHIWFVYLPNGLALATGSPTKPELNTDLLLNEVLFFAPTNEGLTKAIPPAINHPDWVLPWQGFKSFDYYCRDELNGKACSGK